MIWKRRSEKEQAPPLAGESLHHVFASEYFRKFLNVRFVEGEGIAHGGLAVIANLGFAHAAPLDRRSRARFRAVQDADHDLRGGITIVNRAPDREAVTSALEHRILHFRRQA